MTAAGGDGLGVELDSLDGVVAVAQAHDQPVAGPGGDLQAGRQRLALHHQGVVAGRGERPGQTLEHAGPVVVDLAHLAVHHLGGAHHPPTIRLADGLVAEADAEQWGGRAKPLDHGERDARLVGVAGPRGDHHRSRLHRRQRLGAQRVVAVDGGGGAELAEVLHQVVGEGVVVVDDGHNPAERLAAHRPSPWFARSTAASSAATLLSISSAS